MALNTTGAISLAGATTGQSIAVELGLGTTTQISLNDAKVRTLAGVLSGAIIMPTNFYGKSNHVPYSVKVTFTANTSWVVPTGISSIRVKTWGASGGGTNNGVGGYAGGDISVSAGQTLYIAVGGAGQYTGGQAYGGVNGGGYGSSNTGTGGGGFSGVFTASPYTQGSAKIIAGGGAGGPWLSLTTNAGYWGGSGGGNSGGTGGSSTGAPGTGGTQVGGGSAGTGYGGLQNGSALQGGNAANGNSCAGAGGGYWGGGSGVKGGGGSGYVTGTNTSNLSAVSGYTQTVPNNSDVDYVSPYGAQTGITNGNNGYTVILY